MILPRGLKIHGTGIDSANSSPKEFFLLVTLPESHRPDSRDAQHWLSPSELVRYEASGRKRRFDYLLGRRAAKLAFRSFFGVDNPRILTVTNDAEGRPVVNRPVAGLGIPRLSLSHGGGSAAALLHSEESFMGVDINPIVHKRTRVDGLRHMIDDRESAVMLSSCGPVDGAFATGTPVAGNYAEVLALYRLWCLKEALGKALGKGLAAPYPRLHISSAQPVLPVIHSGLVSSRFTEEPGFEGWSLVAGGLCFAIVTPVVGEWQLSVSAISDSDSETPSERHYRISTEPRAEYVH